MILKNVVNRVYYFNLNVCQTLENYSTVHNLIVDIVHASNFYLMTSQLGMFSRQISLFIQFYLSFSLCSLQLVTTVHLTLSARVTKIF